MSTDEPYSYASLEPKYQELAAKELHEDASKLHAHVMSLRKWLQQSRHIKNCPDNDRFLLRYLRAAKYDHEKAQTRLEVYCTMRGSTVHGNPSLYEFPSLEDQKLRYFLDLGLQIPCGYNTRGEIVMIGTMRNWDPAILSYADMVPYAMMGADVILSDERSQIAGMSAVFDLDGFSKKHLNEMMSNQKIMKTWARVWQECMPMRNGSFVYYREPLIFDIVFKIFSFWIKDKLRKRLHRVGTDLSKLHEKMPGAKQALPKEYGGENGTIEELKQRWIARFFDYWRKQKELPKITIDESLRPKDTLKFLKDYEDYPDDIFGKKGTYTKVDSF